MNMVGLDPSKLQAPASNCGAPPPDSTRPRPARQACLQWLYTCDIVTRPLDSLSLTHTHTLSYIPDRPLAKRNTSVFSFKYLLINLVPPKIIHASMPKLLLTSTSTTNEDADPHALAFAAGTVAIGS